MDVLIKRTKLTKSIFKQIVSADLDAVRDYKVLGWCIPDNKVRWIVLQKDGDLRRIPYVMDTRISTGEYESIATIFFSTGFSPWHFKCSSEIEAADVVNSFIVMKQMAVKEGQFYL